MASNLKLPPNNSEDFLQPTTPPIHEPSPAEQAVYEQSFKLGKIMWEKAMLEHAKEGFKQESLTDELTGLPNRRALLKTLDEAAMTERPFGVIIIDLDDFKKINDEQGHDAGDQVLQLVAHRLKNTLRTQPTHDKKGDQIDIIARYEDEEAEVDPHRLGGDEFAAIVWLDPRTVSYKSSDNIPDLGPEARLATIESKIIFSIQALNETHSHLVGNDFGASVGGAIYVPGESPKQTLRRADEQMYAIKHQRQNPPTLDQKNVLPPAGNGFGAA